MLTRGVWMDASAGRFDLDWERVIMQERFVTFVKRENKNSPKNLELPEALDEIKDVIKTHYNILETCGTRPEEMG